MALLHYFDAVDMGDRTSSVHSSVHTFRFIDFSKFRVFLPRWPPTCIRTKYRRHRDDSRSPGSQIFSSVRPLTDEKTPKKKTPNNQNFERPFTPRTTKASLRYFDAVDMGGSYIVRTFVRTYVSIYRFFEFWCFFCRAGPRHAFKRNIGGIEISGLTNFQLCTAFGGRENTKKTSMTTPHNGVVMA
jgi:hypothetical protein